MLPHERFLGPDEDHLLAVVAHRPCFGKHAGPAPGNAVGAFAAFGYGASMAKDEPTIEARARAAAEAAKNLIPQEAWDAARRVGVVRDQLVEGVTDVIRRANQQVGEMIRSVLSPNLEVVDVFRSPEIQDLIKRAEEAFARLPELTRGTLRTLGVNGWYPDDEMSMGDLVTFAKGFDAGDHEKTHDALCAYFESRREAIIAELVAMAPLRERFLRRASETHGVAPLPISAQDDETVPKGALVRHRVLHGTDLDYATRLNSCRALSHLGYVGSVIRERTPTGSTTTP